MVKYVGVSVLLFKIMSSILYRYEFRLEQGAVSQEPVHRGGRRANGGALSLNASTHGRTPVHLGFSLKYNFLVNCRSYK